MDKLGMNFGGGPSRKELLETIEGQKKQLVQYQTRFKDVVRAYKGLLKEKEALEASLKVLTASQEADLSVKSSLPPSTSVPRSSVSDVGDDGCSVHSEDSTGTAASMDTATSQTSSTKGELAEEEKGTLEPLALVPSTQKAEETSGSESGVSTSSGEQNPVSESERRILQLKTQLATLTNALATVTQEKSRMEASYLAEKKMMKQDFEDLSSRSEEEKIRYEAEIKNMQEQLAEVRSRLITQQHERAQEQNDHAVMLRELQKLLQDERTLRQDVELKMEEMRVSLAEQSYAADRIGDYELQKKKLLEEVEKLKKMLQDVEIEKQKPDPRLQKLQEEMENAKANFQIQLQQELKKTALVEEQLRQHSKLEEERVAALEAQVSELSELLGSNEKAKQKDQMCIQKLKERIVQLDMENKTLAIAASSRVSTEINVDEASLDINVLKDKLEKIKKHLYLAVKKSKEPLDIEKLCETDSVFKAETSDGEKATVLYYQQELKQLKEEFERYKMRAQVVLKNKTAKDGTSAKEVEELTEQLSELKEKYIALRLSYEELEIKHKLEMDAVQQEVLHLQQCHKQELEKLENEYKERALKLEGELHKQRDRALQVMQEKDHEIERLKSTLLNYSLQKHRRSSTENKIIDGEIDSSDTDASSSQILYQALKIAGPVEPTFLLYAEQLARKEVEIGALRKQKHKLEAEVHQLQEKCLIERERHQEEIAVLQDQIQKSVRDKGREGANLEYLKNIIYRFLTLQDALGRQQTLTAILTILHFSPQEKHIVMRHQGNRWWTPATR
ncbi:GRIP and coiled-coil domain-containing protein 1 [Protopterus annectens]|uniref:GRIP and coiled-coil domain-containing protein 1 n=1 Tax=Protopterus annectens TaxID=7888 RepID=UPI001CFC07EB|nr:GRIP and coiled-coil domain-containing protein 1 [Protopterus annectens]